MSLYEHQLTCKQWQQADIVITNISTPSHLPAWLKFKSLPILVLCSDSEVATKIAFLNAGAKDCLSIPFAKEEFFARVRALMRTVSPPRILQQDDIQLDITHKNVTVKGQFISMTHREFDLLCYLLSHPNKICHREELLYRVWGKLSLSLETRTVDTHINQLRKKLGVERFRNVHGVGYGYQTAP
ncbi:response regulator transcription factor [Vibrio parahaemolyticus]|nr:response regulator transcription factor [Vibrio parahaemolyticus]